MTHRLQAVFASPEGEESYVGQLRALVETGDLAGAEQRLAADLATLDSDLATLDSDLARLCLALGQAEILLAGWEDLAELVGMQEGEPVTGVAIGLVNDPDATFDKNALHRPEVTIGIYCDGAFAWSAATPEELLAQIAGGEPAWAGQEEDVEIYLELEGLDELNSALLRHKHRHFFRDGDPERAPAGYVEFVLAGWWRALRFHRAVAGQMAAHGLPGNPPVISSLVDMRPEVATVHLAAKRVERASAATGSLVGLPLEARPETVEEESASQRLRRQLAESAANEEEPAAKGFFARLFARG